MGDRQIIDDDVRSLLREDREELARSCCDRDDRSAKLQIRLQRIAGVFVGVEDKHQDAGEAQVFVFLRSHRLGPIECAPFTEPRIAERRYTIGCRTGRPSILFTPTRTERSAWVQRTGRPGKVSVNRSSHHRRVSSEAKTATPPTLSARSDRTPPEAFVAVGVLRVWNLHS